MEDFKVYQASGYLTKLVSDASDVRAEYEEISGESVQFYAPISAPLETLIAYINPVQSGSGAPAHDNVRPITGFTEINVWVKPNYDPTLPATVTVSFPDNQTIYGAYVDLITGDGEITQVKWIENGSRQPYIAVWAQGEDYNCTLFDRFTAGLRQADFVGNENKFICNNRRFVDINGSDKTSANTFASYRAAGSYSFCYSIPKTLSTKAEIADWFAENPSEVVYLLGTPIQFHVDPQIINTLIGENNIWTDTGEISVKYKIH